MTSEVMWPLLCVTLGLVLILVEAFVPSGGLIGLLALGLIVWGVVLAFLRSTSTGLAFLAGVGVLAPLAIALAISIWPHTPLARRAMLSPPAPEETRDDGDDPRLDHLIGQFGRALSPLRPSGLVGFEGRRIDGMADAGLIAAGSLVEAIQIQGRRLVVRAVRDDQLGPVDGLDPGSGVPSLLG